MTDIEQYLWKMKEIAYRDWLSARILWNLGFMNQAIWLLGQSGEKYLKVLWAQRKIFASVDDLENQLKRCSQSKGEPHDINKIFNQLSKHVQDKLKQYPISWIKTSALRYGNENFIYLNKWFFLYEKAIRAIRILLGDQPKNSLFKELSVPVGSFTKKQQGIRNDAFKKILSIQNYSLGKERKADRKRMKEVIREKLDSSTRLYAESVEPRSG